MIVQKGTVYRDASGGRIGPMVPWAGSKEHCWQWRTEDGAPLEDQIYRADGTSAYNPDLIAEWTDGPVRTVTRREIVRGQYADVDVGEQLEIPDCDNPDVPPMRKVAVAYAGFRSSAELKAAAAVLLELAGALSDGE